MGRYDDLIPKGSGTPSGGGRYDDLIPGAKIPKSETFMQKALKGTLRGTSTMINSAPGMGPLNVVRDLRSDMLESQIENPFTRTVVDIASDPFTYGGGALGVKPAAKLASPFGKVITKGRRVETVEKIGKQLQKKRWSTLPRWFGRKIDQFSSQNPTATIDMSDTLKDISIRASTDPKLASVIKHPIIEDLMGDMTKARNMTLAEVQDLKNIVTETVPEAVKSGVKGLRKFRQTNAFTDIINRKIGETFPEMRQVAKTYGEKAEQFKDFIPAFRGAKKVEKTVGKQGVFTYFGSPDYLGGEAAQKSLSKFSPRASKEIGSARRANQILNAAKIGSVGYAATKVPGISWPFRRISEHLVD